MKSFIPRIFATILFFGLIFSELAISQNFTNNTGGTYTAGTNGVIRMKSISGVFDGTAELGLIGSRIQGTVDWRQENNQNVQPRYYTKLATSGGGIKSFSGNVYILDTYLPTGGNREYGTSTIHYDGTTGTQIIAPENISNGGGYYNLDLPLGSLKTNNDTTIVQNVFTHANGVLTNTGSGDLSLGSGASTSDANIVNDGVITLGTGSFTQSTLITNNSGANFNGNSGAFNFVDIVNAGTVNLAAGTSIGTGLVTNTGTFNMGTGSLTLNGGGNKFLNNTGGEFNPAPLATDGVFQVNGNFINNSGGPGGGVNADGKAGTIDIVGDYTNTSGPLTLTTGQTMSVSGAFTRASGVFTFADASTFQYDGGAQTLLGNTNSPGEFVSYGNLQLIGTGAKTSGANAGRGGVVVRGELTVSQETDMTINDQAMIMIHSGTNNDVAYTGGVEVRGKFRWEGTVAGTPYTFNNDQTIITFETAPTGAGSHLTLDIRQQTAPTQAQNFSTTTDINRRIVPTYQGGGKISNLQVMWESTDEVGFTGDRTLFRFAEGYSATADMQKLSRQGATYDRNNTNTTPRYLTYAGGGPGLNGIDLVDGYVENNTDPNKYFRFASGSDLIITATTAPIISVSHGRWTNPGTWDEGRVPVASDNAEINHVVYTGIATGPFGTTPWTDDEVDGSLPGDAGAAANSIRIMNVANATLLIGNEDNTMGTGERIFRTRLSGTNVGIFNLNAGPSAGGDLNGTAVTSLNGIWVRPTSVFTPVLGTLQITNSGTVINNGIIEIGN
ncbi:MAG: hypothetical protein N2319_09140 [Candidatus Kapabacteria bacterium]|nr:hypothetical protein [Candidatus Kapabacteria bacterium]